MAVASAGPYASLHLTSDRQPCQHPTAQFFTDQMPFLPPNQQCQSTEGVFMLVALSLQYYVVVMCQSVYWSQGQTRPKFCLALPCKSVRACGLLHQNPMFLTR